MKLRKRTTRLTPARAHRLGVRAAYRSFYAPQRDHAPKVQHPKQSERVTA